MLGFAVAFTSCNYNDLVEEQEEVNQAWSEVENQYQRRMDLIPNLVNTVKGYAAHEENTLTEVITARSNASSITIQADDLNEENFARFQAAQDELSRGLGRLMAVAEAYPDLKANQNFLQLQNEVADLENKLAAVRRAFNSATKELNTACQSFPNVLFAGMFGFHAEPMFEVPATDRAALNKAPEISF